MSTPIPGMPQGKAAGQRCVQLDAHLRCAIFDSPQRPACCAGLQPSAAMCGTDRGHALAWLQELERLTSPAQGQPGRHISE